MSSAFKNFEKNIDVSEKSNLKKISTGVLDSGDLEEEIKRLEYLEKHPIVSCKRPTISRNKE
jgi:hypothetical protein